MILDNPRMVLSSKSQGNGESIAFNYVDQFKRKNHYLVIVNRLLNSILRLDSNKENIFIGDLLEELRDDEFLSQVACKLTAEMPLPADTDYLNYLFEMVCDFYSFELEFFNDLLKSDTRKPRFIPVTKWDKYHEWPSVSGLRWLIHNSETNGFNRVVVKAGGRVIIDENAFFEWMRVRKSDQLNSLTNKELKEIVDVDNDSF
jgi:hypothetical protein